MMAWSQDEGGRTARAGASRRARAAGRVATKRIASATSAGRSMALARRETRPPLRIERVPDAGIGRPGRDQRQPHAGAAILRQQGLVQAAQTVLARGVGGVLGEPGVIGHAADADEGAPPGVAHRRQERRAPAANAPRRLTASCASKLGDVVRSSGCEQEAAGVAHHDSRARRSRARTRAASALDLRRRRVRSQARSR